MICFFIVMITDRLCDEYRCQVGEDESLDECHQDLDHIYEYSKSNRYRSEGNTCCLRHFCKDEDQAHKAQDDDVTRSHVCKKTHDQGEWLGEYTEQLHRQHHDLNRNRHTREPEDVTPEMAVGAEQDHYKGNDTEYSSESDITCYVCRAGDQTKKGIDQDEEEQGQ